MKRSRYYINRPKEALIKRHMSGVKKEITVFLSVLLCLTLFIPMFLLGKDEVVYASEVTEFTVPKHTYYDKTTVTISGFLEDGYLSPTKNLTVTFENVPKNVGRTIYMHVRDTSDYTVKNQEGQLLLSVGPIATGTSQGGQLSFILSPKQLNQLFQVSGYIYLYVAGEEFLLAGSNNKPIEVHGNSLNVTYKDTDGNDISLPDTKKEFTWDEIDTDLEQEANSIPGYELNYEESNIPFGKYKIFKLADYKSTTLAETTKGTLKAGGYSGIPDPGLGICLNLVYEKIKGLTVHYVQKLNGETREIKDSEFIPEDELINWSGDTTKIEIENYELNIEESKLSINGNQQLLSRYLPDITSKDVQQKVIEYLASEEYHTNPEIEFQYYIKANVEVKPPLTFMVGDIVKPQDIITKIQIPDGDNIVDELRGKVIYGDDGSGNFIDFDFGKGKSDNDDYVLFDAPLNEFSTAIATPSNVDPTSVKVNYTDPINGIVGSNQTTMRVAPGAKLITKYVDMEGNEIKSTGEQTVFGVISAKFLTPPESIRSDNVTLVPILDKSFVSLECDGKNKEKQYFSGYANFEEAIDDVNGTEGIMADDVDAKDYVGQKVYTVTFVFGEPASIKGKDITVDLYQKVNPQDLIDSLIVDGEKTNDYKDVIIKDDTGNAIDEVSTGKRGVKTYDLNYTDQNTGKLVTAKSKVTVLPKLTLVTKFVDQFNNELQPSTEKVEYGSNILKFETPPAFLGVLPSLKASFVDCRVDGESDSNRVFGPFNAIDWKEAIEQINTDNGEKKGIEADDMPIVSDENYSDFVMTLTCIYNKEQAILNVEGKEQETIWNFANEDIGFEAKDEDLLRIGEGYTVEGPDGKSYDSLAEAVKANPIFIDDKIDESTDSKPQIFSIAYYPIITPDTGISIDRTPYIMSITILLGIVIAGFLSKRIVKKPYSL